MTPIIEIIIQTCDDITLKCSFKLSIFNDFTRDRLVPYNCTVHTVPVKPRPSACQLLKCQLYQESNLTGKIIQLIKPKSPSHYNTTDILSQSSSHKIIRQF